MSSPVATEMVLRAVREGLLLVLLVSAPPLLASMVVGFLVNVFQVASQIHDHVLVFVPKVVAMFVVLLLMGPMLASQVVRFSQALLLTAMTVH